MFWRVCAQALQTFFGVLAPLRARHVIPRVEHPIATGFTKPPGIILEELDQSAAVHAGYFVNVVESPVTHILPGTLQYRHGFVVSLSYRNTPA
jgi:hypothetical protein